MTTKIIDRVIFSLTNNETYIDFWNYISKVYRVKFNTTPTLMFTGEFEDLEKLKKSGRISDQYGEIFHLPRVSDVFYRPELDWTCTWGLFYGAASFPNDVCMLSGIDQIPLTTKFFEQVKSINPRKNYIVGHADAYYPNRVNNDFPRNYHLNFPSSHHVGLGSFFKQIYGIDDYWDRELKKVNDWAIRWYKGEANTSEHSLMPDPICNINTLWGTDEYYSTCILKKKEKFGSNIPIYFATGCYENWSKKRLGFGRHAISNDENTLKRISNSEFTECHSERPFSKNRYLDVVFDYIPATSNLNEEL